MGALITLKEMPHNAWREAKLAIAGPLLGSAAALAIYLAGVAFDSQSLQGARVPRLLHQPLQPAPGRAARRGPIAAALHPVLWLVGFLGLLGL